MNNEPIVANHRNDAALRRAFFRFVEASFRKPGFATWHDYGHWTDAYVPHSIVRDGEVVANVSASTMRLLVDGREVRGVQIGTVATRPACRGQGLSARLMDHVVAKYSTSCDLIFLFANETVTDFYPRWGFRRVPEVVYELDLPAPGSEDTVKTAGAARPDRRLCIDDAGDRALIEGLIARRTVLSQTFGAIEYGFITMWHLINLFSKYIVFLPDADAIVVASEEDGVLHVWDIIAERPIPDLPRLLARTVADANVRTAVLYFAPEGPGLRFDRMRNDPDSLLFVRGGFPVADRAFKFPTTAQT